MMLVLVPISVSKSSLRKKDASFDQSSSNRSGYPQHIVSPFRHLNKHVMGEMH